MINKLPLFRTIYVRYGTTQKQKHSHAFPHLDLQGSQLGVPRAGSSWNPERTPAGAVPARRWFSPQLLAAALGKGAPMTCSFAARRAAREGMRLPLLTRAFSTVKPPSESAVPQRPSPFLHVAAPHETREPPGCSPEAPAPSLNSGDHTPTCHFGGARSSIPWCGPREGIPGAAETWHSQRTSPWSPSQRSGTAVYPWSAGPQIGRGLSSTSSCRAAASSSVGGADAGEGAHATLTGVHVFQCEVTERALHFGRWMPAAMRRSIPAGHRPQIQAGR